MVKKWAWILLLFAATSASAQTTSVSGQVVDAASVQWANGTYSFSFVPSPDVPPGPYFQGGVIFNTGQVISGSLDSTGSFSAAIVPDNGTIFPSGSKWTVQVCPAATATNGCFRVNLTITGASQVITSSLAPPAVRVSLTVPGFYAAYNDAEITGAKQGSFYANLTDGLVHFCSTVPPCTWVSQVGLNGNLAFTGNNTHSGTETFRSIISASSNPASAGTGSFIRLASSDVLAAWRKNDNSGDSGSISKIGPASGNLPADTLNFGNGGFGFPLVIANAFGSGGTPIAAGGLIRLASTDLVCWRNNANTIDLCLSKNAGDALSAATFTNFQIKTDLIFTTTNNVDLTMANPAAPRTYTVPDFGSNDSFVGLAATQTLTNKTLTAPVISSGNPTASGVLGFAGGSLNVGDGSFSRVLISQDGSLTVTNKTLGAGTVYNVGVLNAAGTQQTGWHIVSDTATLSGGTVTVTLSGSSVFTSSSSFSCTANDDTGLNPVKVVNNSGSSVTFTGTTTDVVRFICVGN